LQGDVIAFDSIKIIWQGLHVQTIKAFIIMAIKIGTYLHHGSMIVALWRTNVWAHEVFKSALNLQGHSLLSRTSSCMVGSSLSSHVPCGLYPLDVLYAKP